MSTPHSEPLKRMGLVLPNLTGFGELIFPPCIVTPTESARSKKLLSKTTHCCVVKSGTKRVVKKPSSKDRHYNRKLLSEASIMVKLNCAQHCAQLRDVWHKGKGVHLKMDAGLRNLHQIIHEQPSAITNDEFWDKGLDVALAVNECHTKGVLHMDIKPSNIVETNRGCLMLIDFGQSISAPWVIDRDDVDSYGDGAYLTPDFGTTCPSPAWDIFALGVTFLEMATRADIRASGVRECLRTSTSAEDFFSHFTGAKERTARIKNLIWHMLQPQQSQRATMADILATPEMALRQATRLAFVIGTTSPTLTPTPSPSPSPSLTPSVPSSTSSSTDSYSSSTNSNNNAVTDATATQSATTQPTNEEASVTTTTSTSSAQVAYLGQRIDECAKAVMS
ncbi:Protein kinase domain [Pelomyxa schiedti]|nr:Protein kinase domain [Pelomyxa schiedti]